MDILNFQGLNTKTSEEVSPETQLRVADNCDFFKKYGAITKPDGMTRVLNSSIGSTTQIPWLGFYKAADLDGQILRQVLLAGGTSIRRLKADGSAPTVLTGQASNPITTARTADLFHHHDMFEDFMFIQNQNPDLVGQGDDPIKYDGAEVNLWGVRGPGTLETVRQEFNDKTDFTETNATASDDTTTTIDGASVKVVKGTSSTASSIEILNTTSFDASASGLERVRIWVYVPRGELDELANSGRALSVYLGSDVDLVDNFQRFDFEKGSLFEGWNLLSMITDPSPATPAPTDGSLGVETSTLINSAIISYRFEVITNNATDVVNLRWDRMYTTDEGRVTAADGASGTDQLTAGAYQYKATFVTKYGHESNASPIRSVTVATTGNDVALTNIPTSTDPQVIARKLYRTVSDGNIFLFFKRIEDNTTTTHTDTTADLSLGNTSPPDAGDVNDDNSPPIRAGIVKVWKRTVFLAGVPDNPYTVFFSEDNEGESFPALNVVTLDSKITGMYETLSGLVVETEDGKWQVIGNNPDFDFDKVIDNIGCVGRRAAGEARLTGFAADREGLYLYDLNEPIKLSEVIRDKYDAINKPNIEDMHITHIKNLNGLYQFNKDSSGKYTNNFVYQYLQDVQARADLLNGWWWILKLPSASETNNGLDLNILDVEEIEDSNGDAHMYGGGDDGMVYELFNTSTKNFTDAAGTAIAVTTTFQTRYFRPGDRLRVSTDQHMDGSGSGRCEPRYIEVRRTGTLASNWTFTIDTSDGPDVDIDPRDTKVIEVDFAVGQSMRRISIDGNIVAAEYLRVKGVNSQANVDDSILGIRLYFHIRPGQFEV